MTIRYAIRWPDGSETGDITDSVRLAAAYARQHDGVVIAADPPSPAQQQAQAPTPATARGVPPTLTPPATAAVAGPTL